MDPSSNQRPDLTELAELVLVKLAQTVHELSTPGATFHALPGEVLELARAHRELIELARLEQAARSTDTAAAAAATRALRVEGTAGHLIDVVAEHSREELEGRLDDLIAPLEELARAIDHRSVRDYGSPLAA